MFLGFSLFASSQELTKDERYIQNMATKYLMAMSAGDYDEAKKYCNDAGDEHIDMLIKILATVPKAEQKAGDSSDALQRGAKIIFGWITVDIDEGFLHYSISVDPDRKETLYFRKEGEEWLFYPPKKSDGYDENEKK